ncbi:hypothetical protein ASE01_15105 [Nocardioides sp. Root190]|uniref:sensor histidine kinase n=1 Tax=Nocardioides sp. Root190 TaxID=1736488 RepID=UPI0007010012|nr:histidine kinase [Nocardioides sp. Root190]KRB76325.1 hypothetical protein ASE01_15105 [Nocardioides sp. Root190]
MLRRIRDLDERLHARIEGSMHERGIFYPWWIPTTSSVGQLLCVVIALAQRGAITSPEPVTLAVLLILVSPLVHFILDIWLPWWLDAAATLAAAALLMSVPIDAGIDMAPALLALISAEAVARDGVRAGGVVGIVAAGIIVVVDTTVGIGSVGVYLLEVLLGVVVGAMLWWQMRALAAERRARETAWDQATTAERERIAREIHDLVAHSLSISLLQVTGARHTLRDVSDASGPDEVAEAVAEVDAALSDAEQVGRRAMADIRRTVSAMAAGPAERHSLPGAGDIAALVREMTGAGLAVEYDEQGDPAQLPAATGLGLYRITQESLSNVARHGGEQPVARVRLTVGGTGARLLITNPLPAGRVRDDGPGSGLAGMQARAEQLGATLRAGPDDGSWVVDLRLGPGSRSAGGVELPCGRSLWKAVPGER